MPGKYRILIIDEQSSETDDFTNFFEQLSGEFPDEFEILSLNKVDPGDDLYSYVLANQIDAVGFDFRLMEYQSPFTMNGDGYLKQLLSNLENFPAFIMTNKVQDAKASDVDPFRVVDKELININPDDDADKAKGKEFIDNIKRLIENYRKDLLEKEGSYLELLEQSNQRTLSAAEQQSLIDLDNYLEKSFSKTERLPSFLKGTIGVNKLNELVDRSDEILKALKEKDA